MTRFALLVLMVFFTTPFSGGEVVRMYEHDPAVIEELRVRGGLPNFFEKLDAGEKVAVAYLGGSITRADGWRSMTFAWLQSHFPSSELVQINAAVSGTGADFAACRLAEDVLPHRPDLVFVEFRVNAGGGIEARAIEGVVRQIRRALPEAEICFVHTLGEWMLEDFANDRQYIVGQIMEECANVYSIPSIDLAPEVMRRMAAGSLTFRAAEPEGERLHFSKDGVHPLEAGHRLYAEVITRSLMAIMEKEKTRPHTMPPPMDRQNLEKATLVSIADARMSEGWQAVDGEADTIYNRDAMRTKAMLAEAIKSEREGASLTIEWIGTRLGLTHIPQGEGMQILVSTDGGRPAVYTLDQEDPANLYARITYLPEYPQGTHRTTIRIKKLPGDSVFYTGQLLLLRDP